MPTWMHLEDKNRTKKFPNYAAIESSFYFHEK